jgi:hypothetical protein
VKRGFPPYFRSFFFIKKFVANFKTVLTLFSECVASLPIKNLPLKSERIIFTAVQSSSGPKVGGGPKVTYLPYINYINEIHTQFFFFTF